jgi:ATP-binding cassette, subfamily C (CFTR/MRP), member 1
MREPRRNGFLYTEIRSAPEELPSSKKIPTESTLQLGMAVPWRLATTACSPRPAGSCPQHALLNAVNLAFIAASLVHAVRRLRSGGSGAAAPEREALLHKPSSPATRSRSAPAQALSAGLPRHPHGAALWTIFTSGRGAAGATLRTRLRVFWLTSALGATPSSASAAVWGADGSLLYLYPDDALAFTGLLVSLPLAYVAVSGFTGRDAGAGEGEAEHAGAEADATPYAAASLLSRATFNWTNPLISKGYAAGSLTADDIPPVSTGHRA